MGVQELTRSFSVSLGCPGRPDEDAYCLRLTPKKGQPMSVEEIQLWVGKKDFLPLRTESRDVLGNVTRLSFQNGEANVPLVKGAAVLPELFVLARRLGKERIKAIIVDSGSTADGSKNLRRLATEMGGVYRQVRDLHAGRLFDLVRSNENKPGQEKDER